MAALAPHLDGTLGFVFIGVVLAVSLYGCACAQTIFYARNYAHEKTIVKVLVAVLWCLCTAKTCVDVQYLWYYLVEDHANVDCLIPNTFALEFILGAVTIFLVQCFYIYNTWILLLDQWYRIPHSIVALILAITSLVAAMGVVYDAEVHPSFVNTTGKTADATSETLATLVTDIYITISLCLILRGGKPRQQRTRYLISRLILYTIHRGILTAIVQLLVFVKYGTADSDSLIPEIFHLPCSTLYVNALLVILNVRNHLRSASALQGSETTLERAEQGEAARSDIDAGS